MKPQGTSTPETKRQELDAKVGHETSDVSLRGIMIFVGGLVAVAIAIQIGLLWYFDVLKTRVERGEPEISPLAAAELQSTEPPLQRAPMLDMEQLRAAEEKKLHSLEIDKQHGTARIPIELAIDLVAERGLQQPQQQAPPETQPKPRDERKDRDRK